jgi:PEGA domain-containing protein
VSIFSDRDRASRGRSLSRGVSSSLAWVLSLSLGLGLSERRALAQPSSPAPAAAASSAPAAPPAAASPANPAPAAASPAPSAPPATANPAPPAAASPPGATADPPTAPSSAAAAPLGESLQGSARADYAAARVLYEDGDYLGAQTKLAAAYEASKDPRLLWNMAACEKALRHYASVIALLERYLKESAALIGDDERKATDELVQTVREFVNELRLEVQPGGVDVLIDGAKVATTPLDRPLWVDMGKRRLRLEKPGFVTHETEIDLPGGKSVDLKVELAAEVHEGTLRIVSDAKAVITIDGHVVGTGTWTGQLSSGVHSVHIEAEGKRPHDSSVIIKDHDTSSLHASLIDEQTGPGLSAQDSSSGALWWIVGGVALAGAGVGGYFLLRPGDEPNQPEFGTMGAIDLL